MWDTSDSELDGLSLDAQLQIASVGSRAVVLDQGANQVHLPGGKVVTVEGEGLVLQESGPEASFALLASSDALIRVPLDGSAVTTRVAPQGGGAPTRPVNHRSCTYGAWSVTGAFVRDCPEDGDDKEMVVDSLIAAEKAMFRTNRDVIVLNEVEQGGLWLPDADMVMVDNWDQIESKLESEEESEEESVEEDTESLLPDRTKENTPPEAVDDDLGARAGRTTILPVLMNDADADGDYMTVTPISQPSIGEVSVAREGAALQISIAPEASGVGTFEYEVSDGRGGTARAKVTVTIRAEDVNEAPVQKIAPTVALGPGRSATVIGLSNWIDPDGDPFYLADAIAPTGIIARSHEGGSVDIKEVGHGPGKDTITLVVSDGRDEGEGVINVTVKEAGNEPPVANADHLVVREGASATIAPMNNDSDPNGDIMRLVQIDQAPAGIAATMDGTAGTITVDGLQVGTYYLSYVITDGPVTATSFIRIDVVPADSELPPTAEDDMGVLPEGGQVLIDLLANDSDPTGGVLTVQSVEVPTGSPLVAALVNHQLVRVTSPRGITGPMTFTYTVSNGAASAQATVTVLPKPASAESAPPELADDVLVVRSGDVASVAVLANDRSPAGLRLSVSNDLQHEIGADLGTVFISNNVVRVRGGERGGSGRIVYTVSDTMGNVASAVVNLTVVPRDEATNTAPRPKDVTARTVAGRTVTIAIPLDGIDPEGDSTTLVGLASAPTMGTAQHQGSTFEYTPGTEVKGTDTFTYIVEDSLGRQAVGRVRVGVVPRAGTNQSPVALPDVVRVRPGTKVSVAVLVNDIDPDGDPLNLVADSLTTEVQGMEVTERSGRIVVTAPQEEGSHVISYRIEDGAGGSAEGICTVAVTADAPFQAPIARDDEVTQADVQAADGGSVVVDVLANDEDPDGDIQDVAVSSPDGAVTVTGGQVSVALAPQAQTLIYTVTDGDGLAASAVIRVPGTEVTRPILDTTSLPILAKAGELKTININDHIIARDGRQVMLTSVSKVSAGLGWDGSTLVKDATTLTYTADVNFSGPTSVTVEVTDGVDLNDSEGIVATLTLPIEVEPVDNRPPTFTPTAIEVAPGEDAVNISLTPWVKDPDGDDPSSMKYRITSDVPSGVSATISAASIKVSAGAETPRGAAGLVTIEVTDQEGATAEAQVPITVVSSSRPLIQTSPAEITLNAGESQTVDVTQYATNPFSERGPLVLLDSPSVSEGGSATVSGTQLTINANVGFNGSFTVTYRLQDATKDASREVQGTVTATVRDRPDAPSGVSAVSNSAGSALISWTAGSANGAPITSFTVTDHTQGDSKDCGLVTTCLFDGRKNGVDHTFSVTATNEVGESDPSNQAVVNIDIEPETPAAPTMTVSDKQVTATWVPPHNEGSAITEYEVSLSPGGPVTVGAGQTSHTFTGLTNGAAYVVTVKAKNSKGWSGVSSPSLEAIPFGVPGAPATITANYSQLGVGTGSKATVDVSWTPAFDNGRAIEYYTVSAGGVTKEVAAPATSTALEGVDFSASQVVFTVTATNDRSQAASRTSPPASTSVWVVGQPLPPTSVTAVATGNDNEVRLNWGPSPAGQGWNPSDLSYQWRVSGGGWQSLGANGSTVSGNGLRNGQGATIEVRAVGTKTGSEAVSTGITSNAVSPFGLPAKPSVSCRPGAVGWVDCSWSGATDGGRTTQLVLSGNTSETIALSANGQRNFNVGEGGSASLCVKAVQTTPEAGTRTVDGGCASANAPSFPRKYWPTADGGTSSIGGYTPTCTNCQWVRIKLQGWPPNTEVTCWTSGGWLNGKDSRVVIATNGDGYWHGIPPFFGNGAWTDGTYLHNISCDGTRSP